MKQKIVKTESSQLLVSAGKSSRLDAIRKKAGLLATDSEQNKKPKYKTFVTGLNPQTQESLQQADHIINETMNSILNGYPDGKKNTFFKIKYAISSDLVKTMLVKDIFKLLEIDSKQLKHYHLIENLDLSGKATDAK